MNNFCRVSNLISYISWIDYLVIEFNYMAPLGSLHFPRSVQKICLVVHNNIRKHMHSHVSIKE